MEYELMQKDYGRIGSLYMTSKNDGQYYYWVVDVADGRPIRERQVHEKEVKPLLVMPVAEFAKMAKAILGIDKPVDKEIIESGINTTTSTPKDESSQEGKKSLELVEKLIKAMIADDDMWENRGLNLSVFLGYMKKRFEEEEGVREKKRCQE